MKPTNICSEIEARLQIVRKLGSILSWEIDIPENRFTYYDSEYDSCSGEAAPSYDLNEALSRYLQPGCADNVRLMIRDAVRSGRIETQAIDLRFLDSTEKHYRVNGRTLMEEDGRVLIVGSAQDVTEWQSAEREAKERFRFLGTLLDTVSYPVYYKDTDLIYRQCNNAFAENMGVSRDRIIGYTIYDIISKDQADLIHQQDLEVLKRKTSMDFQTRLFYAGKHHDLVFSKTVVPDSEGNIIGLVCIFFEITEKLKVQALSRRLEKIKDLVMAVNNAIIEKSTLAELFEFIIEETLNVMDYADCGAILTIEENHMLKMAASKGYSHSDTGSFRISIEETFQWKLTGGNIDSVMIINDLHTAFDPVITESMLQSQYGDPILSTISSPIILSGKVFGFINIDSTRNNTFNEDDRYLMEYLRGQLENSIGKFQLYESMIYLSNHDPQTDLFNRRYFREALNAAIEKGRRYGGNFLVASFDIDGLKTVNDSFGHLAGDELIRKFAIALKMRCRKTDIIARTGGDEFIAIIYQADAAEMGRKFESMKNYFEINPVKFNENKFICRFSFGIAGFPEDGTTYDELISRADLLMYADKFK